MLMYKVLVHCHVLHFSTLSIKQYKKPADTNHRQNRLVPIICQLSLSKSLQITLYLSEGQGKTKLGEEKQQQWD